MNKIQNKGDPDHVYIDINLYNQPDQIDDKPQFLEYCEQRQSPILPTNAEDWYMSVVRFSLQTGSTLPIWIPKLELGQSNPDLLVYVMTVKYKTGVDTPQFITVSKNVKWYPEDVTAVKPSPPAIAPLAPGVLPGTPLEIVTDDNIPPFETQDLTTGYYYAYSSQHIIRVFNATLRDIYEELYTLGSENGFPMRDDFTYQFFELDANNRWVLNSDLDLFNNNYLRSDRLLPDNGHCALYFNNALYTLLSSFPCCKVKSGGTQESYRVSIANNANANILHTSIDPRNNDATNERLWIQTVQEYDSSSLFCPVQSIVFKTTMIPVSNTLSSPQQIINLNSNNIARKSFLNSGNNTMTDNILTDFQVNMDNISSYAGTLQYGPVGEYRLIDLIGSGQTQFNEINISVFWKDEVGGLHQFFLDAGCNFNIKIMFRKKSFSNN